jgi:hypothetical protein
MDVVRLTNPFSPLQQADVIISKIGPFLRTLSKN